MNTPVFCPTCCWSGTYGETREGYCPVCTERVLDGYPPEDSRR
ncbi:hypothetical protein [Thermincola ferriacetica]|nr:hypothetical protein [Thermincola ferriacetica]